MGNRDGVISGLTATIAGGVGRSLRPQGLIVKHILICEGLSDCIVILKKYNSKKSSDRPSVYILRAWMAVMNRSSKCLCLVVRQVPSVILFRAVE